MKTGIIYYWDSTDKDGWNNDFRFLKNAGIDYIVGCDILGLMDTFKHDEKYVTAVLDSAEKAGIKVVLNAYHALLMNSEQLPYNFLNPLYLSGCLLPYRYSFPKYKRNAEYTKHEEQFLFVDCFDYVFPMFDVTNKNFQDEILKPYLHDIMQRYSFHPAVKGLRLTDIFYAPENGSYSDVQKKQFQYFIKKKYGNIKHLNRSWNTIFKSFSEIKPVKIPFQWEKDWIDWCDYRNNEMLSFAETVTEFIKADNPSLEVSLSETDFSVDRSWQTVGGLAPGSAQKFDSFCLVPETTNASGLPLLIKTGKALCSKKTKLGISIRATKKAYLPAPSDEEIKTAVQIALKSGYDFIEYDYFRMPPFPGNVYPRDTGLCFNETLCKAIKKLNGSIKNK